MDAQSRVAPAGLSCAPRASIARVVLLAALLLVLALLACWWEAGTATGRASTAWVAEAVELYAPHEDLWVRLLRGGLSRITVPVLVLGSAAALVALLIAQSTASAVAAVVVMLGANLTVQVVKRGVLPFVPGLPGAKLSGHMAVAVGAAFVVVLAVAPSHRRTTARIAALLVVAAGVGVVVGSYHTVAEAVAPLLVSVAWIVVVLALFGPRIVAENRTGNGARRRRSVRCGTRPSAPSPGREDA